ncbi:MAG: branched-chain amino acid ABC transporter substrate-binding protein [Candidatus Melainabacteria bacterium]|nr:branched-chain amino acid ABC transporter substrate-binding protein [Candidatus Melainabacteria bacterium]
MKIVINIFLFTSLILTGCLRTPQEENYYKIAVVAPQSGPYSLLGKSIINGADLAVKEVNAQGGVDGKKIVLIKEDDGGLEGEGAFFAYRLTNTEMILGVIGHLNSDISIPASEFYVRAKVPQISPGSTSPYFTEREATKGYVFRTIGRDDVQGKMLADYVIKNGFKRVAILYNDRAYGKTLAGEFARSIKVDAPANLKPSIVFYDMIEVGKSDYGSLLAQLSSRKPDVVFLAGEHDDAGNLVKDFPRYGLTMTQFVGGDGIDNTEFIKIGGKNTEGAIVVSPPPIVDKSFIAKYKKCFHEGPTGYAANSYDATNILINAIKKVKEKDSEKIAREVAITKDFKGVTGSITFNENGDLISPGFVLSRVVNRKFKVIQDDNG